MESSLAARATTRYRARLSSMLQLMFDLENDSEADAKTATSLAPAAMAASKPWKKLTHRLENCHTSMLLLKSHNFLENITDF